jgi:tetratricopeptide (TPR) repeat protein
MNIRTIGPFRLTLFAAFGIIIILMTIRFVEVRFSTVLCNSGYVYLKRGELEKAARNFSAAIRLNKINYLAYEGLGLTHYSEDLINEAIQDYTVAIRFNPKYDDGYYNRGLAFVKKGDFGAAIKDFSQAIQLNSSDFDSYLNRGFAFYGASHYEEAIHDYNIAILLNTNSAEAYRYRGLAYFHKNDYDEAILDYTTAIQLDSENGAIYHDRGYSYYCRQEWGKAIFDYERAIQLNTKNGLAYNDYAWLLATCPNPAFRNGQKAIELSLTASDITGWKSWVTIDTLAAAYAEAGDFTKAVKYQTQVTGMNGMSEADYTNSNHKLDLYLHQKPYQETPPLNSIRQP